MIIHELSSMYGGWFIGNFEPTVFDTTLFEVALKKYSSGSYEKRHYHKVAKEFTLIVSGEVKMNGISFKAGQIIEIQPGEETDFLALTDCETVVIKCPSVPNDKYLAISNNV